MSKFSRFNGNSKDANPEKGNNTPKDGGAKTSIQKTGIYAGEEATEAQRRLQLLAKRETDSMSIPMLDSPMNPTIGNFLVWLRCVISMCMREKMEKAGFKSIVTNGQDSLFPESRVSQLIKIQLREAREFLIEAKAAHPDLEPKEAMMMHDPLGAVKSCHQSAMKLATDADAYRDEGARVLTLALVFTLTDDGMTKCADFLIPPGQGSR